LSWRGEKRSWKEKENIADIYTWKGEQIWEVIVGHESSQFGLHCVIKTVWRGWRLLAVGLSLRDISMFPCHAEATLL